MGMDRIDPSYLADAKKLVGDFLKDESSGGELPSLAAVTKALREGTFAAFTAGALLNAALAAPAEAGASRADKRIEYVGAKTLSENEIDFLAQNVYHEARGEPIEGQLAVLQVTLARLASGKFDRGNGLIDGIIFAPGQYSWTSDPKILLSKMDIGRLANIRAMLSLFVGNKSAVDAVRALIEQTRLPANTYFYKRTDWDENNANEKRMSERTKAMFRSFTPVGVRGQHTFYTDIAPSMPRRSASVGKIN